jgi:hypothetical protein
MLTRGKEPGKMVASGDIRPDVVKSIAARCVPGFVKGS